MVVYTGPDTKLSQFKAPPVTKSSQTETLVNRISVVVFIVQFLIALSLGITGFFFNGAAASPWYLYVSSDNPLREAVVYVLRFVLLISMLIPISIKVTIDAVQYLSSKFIVWDLFFSSGGRASASARNTTISEDLGQIQYVLTDKTGTLTQNVMQLCCCSIGGSVYGDNSRFSISRGGTTALHTQPDLLAVLPEAPAAAVFPMPNSASVLVPSPSLFFTALSLCNTVAPKQQQQQQLHHQQPQPQQPQLQQQQFEYSGASPDEEAFAESCARLGFVLVGRDRKFAVLELYGSPKSGQRDSNVLRQRYNILHNLEFSSDRKMMSVLLRAPSGVIVLISKGADEVMLPLCNSASSADFLRHQQEVIDGFASSGLRTLVVACRGVSEEEYAHWLANVFHPAELQMQGREKALAQAYAKLEVGLHFLGCTGLLDALQENVSDTIHSLQQGGINVWMLTGDKLSTAMQIAVSAGMARDTKVFHKLDSVNPDSHESAIMALSRRALDIGGDVEDSEAFSVQSSYSGSRQRMSTAGGADAAVIFSGSTFAAMSSATKVQLVSACIKFSCVICCRLSPGQKAEIVRLVRSAALPQPTVAMRLFGMRPLERTTLAIGDLYLSILNSFSASKCLL
jgi:phospholipid-translocating ATPase